MINYSQLRVNDGCAFTDEPARSTAFLILSRPCARQGALHKIISVPKTSDKRQLVARPASSSSGASLSVPYCREIEVPFFREDLLRLESGGYVVLQTCWEVCLRAATRLTCRAVHVSFPAQQWPPSTGQELLRCSAR